MIKQPVSIQILAARSTLQLAGCSYLLRHVHYVSIFYISAAPLWQDEKSTQQSALSIQPLQHPHQLEATPVAAEDQPLKPSR